jgi:hypothetical protein
MSVESKYAEWMKIGLYTEAECEFAEKNEEDVERTRALAYFAGYMAGKEESLGEPK